MENKINELKQSLTELLDNTEDKAMIEKIAVINRQVDDVSNSYQKLEEENKSILKDYKDLYKTTAFNISPNTKVDDGRSTEFSVSDFIKNWKPEK